MTEMLVNVSLYFCCVFNYFVLCRIKFQTLSNFVTHNYFKVEQVLFNAWPQCYKTFTTVIY